MARPHPVLRPFHTHQSQISIFPRNKTFTIRTQLQTQKHLFNNHQVISLIPCTQHYIVRHVQSVPQHHNGPTPTSQVSTTIDFPDTVPELLEHLAKISGKASIIDTLTTAASKFSSANRHTEVVELYESITKTMPMVTKETAAFKKLVAKSMCKLNKYHEAIVLLKPITTSATCFDILLSTKDQKDILPEHVEEILNHLKESNMPLSHQFLNNIILSYLNSTQTERLIEISQIMATYKLFEPHGTRQMLILSDAFRVMENSSNQKLINFVSSVIKSCFKHRMAPIAFQFFAKYAEQLPQESVQLVFEHLNGQKVQEFVTKLGTTQKITAYKILLHKATTSSDTENMKKYYALLKETLSHMAKDVQNQLAQDAQNNDLESGFRHFNELVAFELPDVPTQADIGCMINLCAKFKKPELLNHFVNQSLDPNQMASLQIEVCIAAEKFDMAVELLSNLDKVKVSVPKPQLIDLCKTAVNNRHGKLFLACIKRLSATEFSCDVESVNKVLSKQCQTDMALAVTIFCEMLLRKVKPNTETFNYLLEGYARQSDLKNMLDCFKTMTTNGFLPNSATISLVQGELEKARVSLHPSRIQIE